MGTTILLADKKPGRPGILGLDGTMLVSAANHKIVRIGKIAFWQEGGIIHRNDEKTGEWGTVTATQFRSTLELFKDIHEEALRTDGDPQHLRMKLHILGVNKKEVVKQWYDEGMELIRDAFEHGAPEDPQGPAKHKGHMPKWFRFK